MNRICSRVKRFMLYVTLVTSIHKLGAAVIWMAPSTTPDAIDMNLTIDGAGGPISLQGPVVNISANTVDIVVTILNNPVVQGNLAGPSVLYLNTLPGRTITFNVDTGSDLTFQGSQNATKDNLLIVHTGNGVVNFSVNAGRTLSFTSSNLTGGTQYYQLMKSTTPVPQTIFFEGPVFFSSLSSTVRVGPRSLIGYLAQTAFGSNPQEQGLITFLNSDTTGLDSRFNLDIQDTGAIIVSGVFTSSPTPTLATINRTIGAGLNAELQITRAPIGIPLTEGSLLVTNRNNTLSSLRENPFNLTPNPFNGILYGFIIGANGSLDITSNSYLDYVGLTLNQCPLGTGTTCSAVSPSSTVKARNPSALIIDGAPNANPALISLEACSAIFFRSGVDNNGVVENDITSPLSFTITPTLLTPDQGNIVFDVEGEVNARGPIGSAGLNTKFEILSLFVQPSGARVLIENTACPAVFPLRTFNGAIYNSGAFLINNDFSLFDTSINHTDQNHLVFNDNDILSQPAYIGGESFLLTTTALTIPHPKIEFINSKLYLHTSAAFTGVDLFVPNGTDTTGACIDNVSNFVFYQNGKACDMGTGRTLILGTASGSTACDGCTVISRDAHLDVMQETDCPAAASSLQQKLLLTTAANDNTIIAPVPPCVIDPVTVANQFSVQTIFLGNSSNISIGSQLVGGVYPFTNPTDPKLFIAGNFFSFATRGGPEDTPSISNVTGVGGIFVDSHGTLCICPQYRASVATMVTRSGSGQVNLNRNQVFFDNQIGIADWQLDLTTGGTSGVTIIPTGSQLSDYTLNWIGTKKDYTLFMPYEVGLVSSCTCPPVIQMNVQALPVIKGEVNQLQIQGSRIGDPSNVVIDGGWVREVIFEILNYSAEAPNGIFILRNFGRLGLGTAHRNPDSLEANIVLGSNGVMLIADGNGVVQVNEDLIINNVCSILRGPNFQPGNLLEFTSDTPKSIRITKSGVLDLRQFQLGEKVQFGGQITLILEPGARIILANSSILAFTDAANLYAEPYAPYQAQTPPTNDVTATDAIRAKLIGEGILQFSNNATFSIPKNAFVGVETLFELDNNGPCADVVSCGTTAFICEIPVTNITVFVTDSGRFIIGDTDDATAGAFQVGNTTTLTGHSVNFTLSLFGPDARTIIKQQGFMGFGVGIVDKRDTPNPVSLQGVPNGWKVGSLFNVTDITFLLNQGQFRHDLIYPGNDPRASLLAFSNDALYTALFGIPDPDEAQQRTNDLNFNGGGNMILISSQTPTFNPVVTNVNGTVTNGGVVYTVGILASSFLQDSDDLVNVSGTTFFTALSTLDSTLINRCTQLANFAQGFVSFRVNRTQYRAGYIDAGFIGRQDISDIIDINGGTPGDRRNRAQEIGAINIKLNINLPAPGQIVLASQIQ